MHETNERYRRLVELSPDGIFISQDTRIVFVNPAAVRLFGASTAEQVLGRSPFDIVPSRQPRTHPRTHRAADVWPERASRPKRRSCGWTGRSPTSRSPARCSRTRTAARSRSIMRDITERKQTEAALRESEERLTLAFAGRAGRRLGLEPRNRRRRVLARDGSRCSATPTTRSNRTSAPGSGCCIPTTGRAPTS